MLWAYLGKSYGGGDICSGLGRIVRTSWVRVRKERIQGEHSGRSQRKGGGGVVQMFKDQK